jgi:hypothetical protein
MQTVLTWNLRGGGRTYFARPVKPCAIIGIA